MEGREHNEWDYRMREFEENSRILQRKLEELEHEVLSSPEIPEEVKQGLRDIMKERSKPEPYDGLIVGNRITGYDPETFEPIYEGN